jgi:hypothetical protein
MLLMLRRVKSTVLYDLSILELGSDDFPCLVQNTVREASSDSSTGSDWFDAGLAPEDVLDEERLDASVAHVGVSTEDTIGPSSCRRGSGRAPRRLRGRSCVHALYDSVNSWGHDPRHWRSSSSRPHDRKFVPKKPRGQNSSLNKPRGQLPGPEVYCSYETFGRL